MKKVYVVQIDNMESGTNNIIIGVCKTRLAAQQLIARMNADSMDYNDAYYEIFDLLDAKDVHDYSIED